MHKNGAKWRRYTRVSVDKNPSSPPLPLDQNVKLRIIDKSSFSRQNFLIGHDKSRQDCRQYPRNGRIRDIRGYSILYHSPPLPLLLSLPPSSNLRGEPVSRVNLRRRGARGKLEKRIRDWRGEETYISMHILMTDGKTRSSPATNPSLSVFFFYHPPCSFSYTPLFSHGSRP